MSDRPVIVVRDVADANTIKRKRLAQNAQLLTLTPAAAAVFVDDQSYEVIRTTSVYGDDLHARTVEHLKDGLEEFDRLARLQGLTDTQIEATRITYFYKLATASFFWHSLRGFTETFWLDTRGKLKGSKNFDEVFEGVFGGFIHRRMLKPEVDIANLEQDGPYSALHFGLLKLYKTRMDKLMKGRKKLLIIDKARPSSQNFAHAAYKQDPSLVMLLSRPLPKSLLKTVINMAGSLVLMRSKKEFTGTRLPRYFFWPQDVRSYMPEIEGITAGVHDEFRKATLKVSKKYLEKVMRHALGHELQVPQDIARLAPDIISTDSPFTGFAISACRTAKSMGKQVVLFNHASHTPQTEEPSKTMGNLWASLGRLYNEHSTILAARAPSIAELVKELSPHCNKVMGVRQTTKLAHPQGSRPFQILFAGNYMGVHNHIPWMLETPDEFLDGIAELAQAVSQIPQARLLVRVKVNAKPECNPETLRKLLPKSPNVEISNEGTFKQALAQSDLLVACISTTIDEALGAGRPVLLHSTRGRYHHLPGMSTPPTAAHRSAVYVSGKTPLVALLKGVMDAHRDRPLNEAELKAFIWPYTTPNMDEFARFVLGAPATQTSNTKTV
ncbi:glycosyltransferase family protein [Hylemonella gracilis]|uniref:Uncharacterized protein n=1 Tax=Hylemonella gracilis ATCC 19624 TaxID=887062 RepID=F3KS25_9BURK|nr:hypothetical protein [Hylemonella gracilis]EGI77385.1 hypothetical protein HGR_06271 [Hylemonella gracilis ATCC 19624]